MVLFSFYRLEVLRCHFPISHRVQYDIYIYVKTCMYKCIVYVNKPSDASASLGEELCGDGSVCQCGL